MITLTKASFTTYLNITSRPFLQQAYGQIFKDDVTIYNYSPHEGNTKKGTRSRRL
jgi:hypothetical protein